MVNCGFFIEVLRRYEVINNQNSDSNSLEFLSINVLGDSIEWRFIWMTF
jgi:hypothetical protein